MSIAAIAEIDLHTVRNRSTLFAFLKEKLAWPVDPEDTFMYQGPQLHGDVATRANVSQIVPFTTGDPFTIMLVEFESGFRRTDLREILRLMRQEIRTRAKYEGRKLDEIIFVCTECEAEKEEHSKAEQKEQDYCGIRFAHFEEQEGRQAKIRVFGWDSGQPGSIRTLIEYNLPALVMPMRNMLGETDWMQAKWREAWDVAKVTGRFYDDYKEVFKWAETQITGIVGDQRLFTQRLFNRMMFVHFLSKKGWLRFNGNRDYFAALWSGRDKGQNFYRAHLWPLFSHGLNNPHIQHNNAVNQSRFGDVPYLNGGLFEKAASDEQGEEIPDAVFERIFGLFDRWNFTVTESTPLDVEVAVDPEMLGKVFEELVTGRHETGSYYTPRPVVMFMCREALKGYLIDAFGSEYADAVAGFVDEAKTEGLPREDLVLDTLKRVRACDPACGSGAYLLGMMQELLRLRETLFRARPDDYKSIYDRKLEIIERNLYGADKDEFAVSIAMLRLWLSLVVDDRRCALTQPRPDVSLPNLKFKICIGDSLTAPAPDLAALAMFRAEYEKDANQLHGLYEKYFLLSRDKSGGSKAAIEQRIEAVQGEIAKLLESACDDTVVDWRICFAEVFAPQAAAQTMDGRFAFTNDMTAQQAFIESESDTECSGFDIVMANPPYVRQELLGKEYKESRLKPIYPAVYSGTADLYCYFYARALQLLRPGGMLAFISPNKWFRAGYGANLRKHIAETCRVISITDFGELPVFETAATFPMIFVAQRYNKNVISPPLFTSVKSLGEPYPDVLALIQQTGQKLPADALRGSNWTLTSNESATRLRKMEQAGVTLKEYVKGQILRGVVTGLNAAFYITDDKRRELIFADPKSAEIIKPLAVGDNVRRWNINHEKWFIVTHVGIEMTRYPAVFAHLQTHQEKLEKRWDKGKHWWELRACAYYDAFAKPKIIYPDIGKEARFTLDVHGHYLDATATCIASADLYLLGLLNSRIVWEYICEKCAVLGDVEQGGRIRLKTFYVEQIPIPDASVVERQAIAALVQKCLDAKGVGCEVWEAEINERVAALYGL